MTIRKDLTGQKFNSLTIIKELGRSRILCRCDCGNEKEFDKFAVTQGRVKTCGATIHRVRNIVGQRFGKFIVIKELGGEKVMCHCDCGNDKSVFKSALFSGRSQSCGCTRKNSGRKNIAKYDFEGTNLAMLNAKLSARNSSGVKGVSFDKRSGLWEAQLQIKGTRVLRQYFKTLVEATAARRKAEEMYINPLKEAFNIKKQRNK